MSDAKARKYVHVNFPSELLKRYDAWLIGKYNNRTSAIVEAVREQMDSYKERHQ
jgi:metal-responsive CopG/Arc/MetJ family transcriptional regulator